MDNLIRLAIKCAGGYDKAAAATGLNRSTLARAASGTIPFPAQKIGALAAAADNRVTSKELTRYIADLAADRARAKVLAKAQRAEAST
jgi:DNA-binding transcriptional regulator YdaS (Cro superfamily)